MATQPKVKSGASSIALIASPIHTAIVIALGVANAARGVWFAGRVRAGLLPDRPTLYLRTILFECVMLSVALAGLKLRGTPLQVVLGKRWRSAGEMFRDVGIGIALWFATLILVSLLSGHNSSADGSIRFLIPQTMGEFLLWVALAIIAGISEEAVFRGYYQQQFAALTRSAWGGVLLSSGIFAAVHAYQGWGRALIIGASAIIYGLVANWRGTVRPGMIAHALQDAIAPVLLRLLRQ
jgi:CAAX protease family protein